MQDFRKKSCDTTSRKFLPRCYLGISILAQPFIINLESFQHGAKELVMNMETGSIVYLFSARILDRGGYGSTRTANAQAWRSTVRPLSPRN